MRFQHDGPSIPDDLLIARDQGRVILFCGAGVSSARAGLPSFFGLTKRVIEKLGVPVGDPAVVALREAERVAEHSNVSGLISADRIFGLLEADFPIDDIEAKVARSLKPKNGKVDLSAHKILLDLATTPEGRVRLVTTNFDRLFSDCRDLQSWQPRHLPDPINQQQWHGVIYLHGRVNDDYSAAEEGGFVLSTSEFGRAYISDAWATLFFKKIIERYVVVFVGYTADDPPVRYLLEALNKTAGKREKLYAFQAGETAEAKSRWAQKGVEAIAYANDDSNTHIALWQTLEAWAARARNPDDWYAAVIRMAKNGPESLQPHERGQVAHVVSTSEGVRKFRGETDPPSAEWLAVFDSQLRYGRPGQLSQFGTDPIEHYGYRQRGPFVDPFDVYGLDSDVAPTKIGPEDLMATRHAPVGAWDAFTLNRIDRSTLREDSLPVFKGHWLANMPTLPPRLREMGFWIGSVANQPASVWWAAHQRQLHPDIQERVRWTLTKMEGQSLDEVRQSWLYLFDAWEQSGQNFRRMSRDLGRLIARSGWSRGVLREYAAISRPYLQAKKNFFGGPKPPKIDSAFKAKSLIQLDVEYPDSLNRISIPEDWLALTTRELRRNLETALDLETEIGGYGLHAINPIVPDKGVQGGGYQDGLSKAVSAFSLMFSRLAALDGELARHEFAAWPRDDDTIFARLQIWAAGIPDAVSAGDFGPVLDNISDTAFWSARHQRDLLFSLAGRWSDLPKAARQIIEKRVLAGPPRLRGEADDDFNERKAWSTLNRLTWMADNECPLTLDVDSELKKLQSAAPKWKREFSQVAAASLEARGGQVQINADHTALLAVPLRSVLNKARELAAKSDDSLTANDPFYGLSAKRPVRAFTALSTAAGGGDYPEWAWDTFLSSDARQRDRSKFTALIALRLSRYPNESLVPITWSVSNWLSWVSNTLAIYDVVVFDALVQKLIGLISQYPSVGLSTVTRGDRETDWNVEASDSPVGKIASALFRDPRVNDLHTGDVLSTNWIRHCMNLLRLKGNLRCYALAIFGCHLNLWYAINSAWTESHIFAVLEGHNEAETDAIWSGFLMHSETPNELLFRRMKDGLLSFAKNRRSKGRGQIGTLAAMILAGWGRQDELSGDPLITDDELRDVLLNAGERFRIKTLRHAERWSESDVPDASEKWDDLLTKLLSTVWPRQLSVRSPKMSATLFDTAFSKETRFPQNANKILSLLTKIDQWNRIDEFNEKIISSFPERTLALIYRVLPDDVSTWPYWFEEALHNIIAADDSLKNDERLLELRRKWDSR